MTIGAISSAPITSAHTVTEQSKIHLVPKFWDAHPQISPNVINGVGSTVTTIPTWKSSFTYQGTTYPYIMVGTDPAQKALSTTVPTTIIPLKVVFSDGTIFDGTHKVKATKNSPIFQKAKFSSGTTQYGDAIQRAEFWNSVKSTKSKYHVYLGQPRVLSTVTMHVPAQSGTIEHAGSIPLGLIEINWFDSQLQSFITQNKLSARSLPIFLSYNTFLYQNNAQNCCIMGYHSAMQSTNTSLNTYAYSAYSDPGIFSSAGIRDINALSHEVAEWLNDPFTNNTVPNWSVASQPQYGCSNALEVGDPLVGVTFTVNGYHPQDEVFLDWFTRQSLSRSIKHRYTYLGTYTTPSVSC
jgi:hypothetical protein